MTKIAIVYWSGTGNTEIMAQKILMGALASAKEKEAQAEIFTAIEFDADKLKDFDVIAFGCPSMGAEVLEESEFEPMFESCKSKLGGKKIALFGSYGWGDGEWMRTWEEDVNNTGANVICESLILNETPDAEGEKICFEFGLALA